MQDRRQDSPRDDGQDREVVRRQRAALGQDRRSAGFQREIGALLQRRREESVRTQGAGDERGGEQFEVIEDGSPTGTPVVRGVLLVRAAMRESDPALLEGLSARFGEEQERLAGRLLVLRGGLSASELVDIARTVRDRGHECSVSHVLPLAVVCKGEGGPGRTGRAPAGGPKRAAPDVGVAVVDTGAAVEGREHSWQSGLQRVDNQDLVDVFPAPGGDGLLDAAAGHGAFAIGLVQQAYPAAAVSAYRAIDSDGIGSEVDVADALLEAVLQDRAEVVNLSLGTQTLDDQPLLAVQIAFELLDEAGADPVLVAAAGNYGDRRPCWPAAFRRVVAVAALTDAMEPAPWSSRGHWVDLSTVGEGLVSTYVRGTESPDLSPAGQDPDDWPLTDPEPWAVWSGTSFAAPQVAAEIGRRLAALRAGGRRATAQDALVDLVASGRRLPDFGVAVRLLPGTPV